MNIKNYTSQVPVDRSMAKIEKSLLNVGAMKIMRSYNTDQDCVAISFVIPLNGNDIGFQIPSREGAIYSKLYENYQKPTVRSAEICADQAARTAWKIISDWVEIQATMVMLDQADLMQVFLPYVHDGNTSLYEKLKENGFKLLK